VLSPRRRGYSFTRRPAGDHQALYASGLPVRRLSQQRPDTYIVASGVVAHHLSRDHRLHHPSRRCIAHRRPSKVTHHADAESGKYQAHNGSGRLRTFVGVCGSARWLSLLGAVVAVADLRPLWETLYAAERLRRFRASNALSCRMSGRHSDHCDLSWPGAEDGPQSGPTRQQLEPDKHDRLDDDEGGRNRLDSAAGCDRAGFDVVEDNVPRSAPLMLLRHRCRHPVPVGGHHPHQPRSERTCR
jgi:hypothetical protein